MCTEMLIHAIAHGEGGGGCCTDTVRESALKVDWEKNPLPHRGIEPASAACRSGALPTKLHPHISVYIDVHLTNIMFIVFFYYRHV